MREFRDAEGVDWFVFFTARSVARDQHLPQEYRGGWLAFESATGEKRRLAPVPNNWEALSGDKLTVLCASATPQSPRKRLDREPAPEQPESLQPQLVELETKLSSALGEVCELPSPQKLDTGELIRVEETLAIAAEAAKEAVSLRRKLRADRERRVRDSTESRPRADDHG